MSMRITTMMTTRSTLADLNDDLSRLNKLQDQLSSGKSITRPSDDPYGASRAMSLSGELEGNQQQQRNVGDGTGWLNTSDTALSQISDAMQRARELLVQGASDTASPQARAAAADEIDQLTESIKQEANVQYSGRYIFSGTATGTAPYALGGADTYAGDSGTITREIGPGVQMGINVDISPLLGNGQGAADGKLLDTLRTISQNLRGGTPADANALRTTDLQQVDANLDTLNGIRADVGARTNRLSIADSRLSSLEVNTTQLLSDTQDADIAQTITSPPTLRRCARGRTSSSPRCSTSCTETASHPPPPPQGDPVSTIDSTRFGRIEVAPGSVIEFPHGLIGLDSRRFTLVAQEPDAAFLWLHSLEDPTLALPVADPRRFFSGFALELAEGEQERLALPDAFDVYVTVRASDQLEEFTANLRAPLVIAGLTGHQVINQAPGAELRAPLFAELSAAAGRAA
jgi:flagellar hook-associated protein 3 FlgL